jgi:hypothetical protein
MDEWMGNPDKELHFNDDEERVFSMNEDEEIYVRVKDHYTKWKVTNNPDRLGGFALDRVLFPELWTCEDKNTP